MVHDIGNVVTSYHWAAVKAVLVFNAGCIVKKHAPMTKDIIHIECLTACKKSIDDLDNAHFSKAARTFSWLPTGTKVYQSLARPTQSAKTNLTPPSSLLSQLFPAAFPPHGGSEWEAVSYSIQYTLALLRDQDSSPGSVMLLQFPGICDFSQGWASGILKISRKRWRRGTIYPV
jgi:hypothetical protein